MNLNINQNLMKIINLNFAKANYYFVLTALSLTTTPFLVPSYKCQFSKKEEDIKRL